MKPHRLVPGESGGTMAIEVSSCVACGMQCQHVSPCLKR